MGYEEILDLLCDDMQHECDCAIALREQCPIMAAHRDGVAEGLHRAIQYLDVLILGNKKAAMPASTAVNPLEEDISCNKSIAETTEPVKEVASDGGC